MEKAIDVSLNSNQSNPRQAKQSYSEILVRRGERRRCPCSSSGEGPASVLLVRALVFAPFSPDLNEFGGDDRNTEGPNECECGDWNDVLPCRAGPATVTGLTTRARTQLSTGSQIPHLAAF